MYETFKTFHVLSVILLGGTVLIDALSGPMMAQMRSVAELRAITRLSRLNQFLGVTAAVLVPIFGYLTANELSISLDVTWILIAQVLFWLSFAIGLAVLMPGALRLARQVEALPDGPIPDEIIAEMKRPVFPVLGILLTFFFVFIVYLMVARPDW